MAPHSRSMSSEEKIFGSKDVLGEILLFLSVTCLVRFKCVSKHWLNLISSPEFAHSHSRRYSNLLPISGMFFVNPRSYIPLPNERNPRIGGVVPGRALLSLGFLRKPRIRILSSCNGLIVCTSGHIPEIHVFNPTTKKFTTLPPPPLSPSNDWTLRLKLTLAFDPSRSQHFKVLYFFLEQTYKTQMYSSQSRTWSLVESTPLRASEVEDIKKGVYVNGAIYWQCPNRKNLVRFDVNRQRFDKVIMVMGNQGAPNTPPPERQLYFGACKGKLLRIVQKSSLVAYEMDEDSSTWVAKYVVDDCSDIRVEIEGFPAADHGRLRLFEGVQHSIVGVVAGQEEDGWGEALSLVIKRPSNKVILWRIREETAKLVADFEDARWSGRFGPDGLWGGEEERVLQYTESLSPVL